MKLKTQALFLGAKKERYLFEEKLSDSRLSYFTIYFKSKMVVTEQLWVYSFLAYVAENGGFVGLFLGYSVLQLRDFINYILETPSIIK